MKDKNIDIAKYYTVNNIRLLKNLFKWIWSCDKDVAFIWQVKERGRGHGNFHMVNVGAIL